MRLRNLALLIILVVISVLPSRAAIQCGTGSNNVVLVSSRATIPDSDWTFACRMKHNTGAMPSADFNIMTFWNEGGDGWGQLIVRGTSSGFAGVLVFDANDDDQQAGSQTTFGTSGSTFNGNTNWRIIAMQRSGNTLAVIRDGANIGSSTNANFNSIGGPLHFGLANWEGESAGAAVTFAGCALYHRTLSSTEWSQLAAGIDFSCLPGAKELYAHLIAGPQDLAANSTTTNTCSVVEHPRTIFCGE